MALYGYIQSQVDTQAFELDGVRVVLYEKDHSKACGYARMKITASGRSTVHEVPLTHQRALKLFKNLNIINYDKKYAGLSV